jgi:hypothetical protein
VVQALFDHGSATLVDKEQGPSCSAAFHRVRKNVSLSPGLAIIATPDIQGVLLLPISP